MGWLRSNRDPAVAARWVYKKPMSTELTQTATLPGGKPAAVTVADDYIVVRVEQRLCVAHHNWMDLDQARRFAAAVFEMADD